MSGLVRLNDAQRANLVTLIQLSESRLDWTNILAALREPVELPDDLVQELRSTEPHVCTCGEDETGEPKRWRGCSEGFEDRCRFERALRELVGHSTTDGKGDDG